MKFCFRYFYILCLILFSIFFIGNKEKSGLRKIFINDINSNLYSLNKEKNFLDFKSLDNRVSVGKIFFLKDDNYWYQISLLTLWSEDFLDLKNLDKFFFNTKIKFVDDSNYGLRNINNEDIVYACMKNSNKFFYQMSENRFNNPTDLNYWKKIYIKNIINVIFKFKPTNYECLLVLTSNKEFFNVGQEAARNSLMNKITYSLKTK